MDRKTAGLLGAVAGLASMGAAPMGAARAATSPARNAGTAVEAASYAELLKPIPDAARLLREDDAARARLQDADGYVYFNYGPPPPPPPPPYAYQRYYAAPVYGPYRPQYYEHHHHHHHHHHHPH